MRIITAWLHISPDVTVKGFKKCCISIAADGTDDNTLWNGSEGDGNVKSMRKMTALTVQMELVTLTCFEHTYVPTYLHTYIYTHTHTHTCNTYIHTNIHFRFLNPQKCHKTSEYETSQRHNRLNNNSTNTKQK
jgi:hypothetical protein